MSSQDAAAAVLVPSIDISKESELVRGFDFENGNDLKTLLDSYRYFGFQATNFGLAVEEITKMLQWRLSDIPPHENEADEHLDPEFRAKSKCVIFLSYTSNMASCGVRDVIKYLAKNKMVDCIVTTAGGVEEDLIKCLAPTFHGDFALDGVELRKKGLNRIGNLLVPNDNYVKFEEWIMPLFNEMHDLQETKGERWTPSKMIQFLGEKIDNEDSIYYWCAKNKIPVFCPAVTDGSIGDMLYFHTFKRPGLILDVVEDIAGINNIALKAKCTGAIVLGGGVVKHHVLNANLMKNGLNYCVLINTGNEFDGSDSGARPDEAKSWGKIAMTAKPVKIYGEATLIFPLLVAQTFATKKSRDEFR